MLIELTFLLAAASPSYVTFSFHPCGNVRFERVLPLTVGVAGLAPDGQPISINGSYKARWMRRDQPAEFDIALPSGAYEYTLNVDEGSGIVCYTQAYTAALAGYARHEYAQMIEGLPDPFTAAAVVGRYLWDGKAALGFIPADTGCGDRPRDFVDIASVPSLDIENGAYYAVLSGPWPLMSRIAVLRLQHNQRTYYVHLPFLRPQPSPGEINGAATFIQYDIDTKRVTQILASQPDRFLCVP